MMNPKDNWLRNKPPLFVKARACFYGVKRRCENENYGGFRRYGGRGIRLKIPYHDFIAWYIQEAKGRLDLTIDRIDNDGHYELDNIQLITRSENLKKAHLESKAMMAAGRKSIARAAVARRIKVKIGGKSFQSISDAGRYFSPTNNPNYIVGRMRYYNSTMPNGTQIELVSV